MTRSEALAAGLSVYWTGNPCKHGHLANRLVSNWTCVVCHAKKCAEFQPKWREKNSEKITEYQKKHAATHAEYNKVWRKNNKEKCAETAKKWQQTYAERANNSSKEWRHRNREAMNALKAQRRAALLSRLPKWLSLDEKWMIKEAYEIAKLRTKITGIKWHVDHVLPLRGANVSGLHTPYNLQVITAYENLKKGNTYATSQIKITRSLP